MSKRKLARYGRDTSKWFSESSKKRNPTKAETLAPAYTNFGRMGRMGFGHYCSIPGSEKGKSIWPNLPKPTLSNHPFRILRITFGLVSWLLFLFTMCSSNNFWKEWFYFGACFPVLWEWKRNLRNSNRLVGWISFLTHWNERPPYFPKCPYRFSCMWRSPSANSFRFLSLPC